MIVSSGTLAPGSTRAVFRIMTLVPITAVVATRPPSEPSRGGDVWHPSNLRLLRKGHAITSYCFDRGELPYIVSCMYQD